MTDKTKDESCKGNNEQVTEKNAGVAPGQMSMYEFGVKEE